MKSVARRPRARPVFRQIHARVDDADSIRIYAGTTQFVRETFAFRGEYGDLVIQSWFQWWTRQRRRENNRAPAERPQQVPGIHTAERVRDIADGFEERSG